MDSTIPAIFLLVLVAFIGNAALWVGVLNRSHGLGIWRPIIHACTILSFAMLAFGPVLCGLAVASAYPAILGPLSSAVAPLMAVATQSPWFPLVIAYAGLCVLWGGGTSILWLLSGLFNRPTKLLVSNHTIALDLASRLRGADEVRFLGRLAAPLPGNQIHRLDVNEKTLSVPGLPAGLRGFSIAHLTDFHFSGRISAAYFREVVNATNDLQPDLVAITGDIVDVASCIAWIPETLGRLVAPHGVWFILGNHDRRVDRTTLRKALGDAGLIDIGSSSRRLNIDGETVLIAGNELPWIGTAPAVPPVDDGDEDPAFRVLLSHSPDQIGWARRHGFQLMLAGHTHGGQIRLPLIGAVLVPSLHGTKYAAGTFYEAPTLLHVSRGVSSLSPLRFNCPPELALLRLTRAAADPVPAHASRTDEPALLNRS